MWQSWTCLAGGMLTPFLQLEIVVSSYGYGALHGSDEEVVRCARHVFGFAPGGGIGSDVRDLKIVGVDVDDVPDFERFGVKAIRGFLSCR